MRCRFWSFFLIILVLLAPVASASPAHLGSAFADAYSAFAPLYALYRSYAEYLFQGTDVVVPPGLETACQSCSKNLETLQVTFIVQTDSQRVEEVGYLVRLREKLSSFCESYRESIATIAVTDPIELTFLDQAAEEDLFASISNLNELFEELLNLTIENLKETHDRWAFNATFATRTLLTQETIERIDPALEPILLGSEEASPPPEDLPEEIIQALQSLAALSGRDLSLQEQVEAGALARTIHAFLVEEGNESVKSVLGG